MKRFALMTAALALLAAACTGSAVEETTTTTTTTTATSAETTTTEAAGPAVAPSEIVFEDQTSDGTTIVVASVTLPSPGFIAVHGNADGGPGPVIGHSELLSSGTSTDVMVTLDEPLTETDLAFPMVHIDFDEDGEYDFFPPDVTDDVPGMTEGGDVAVVGAEVTVEG
jgi:hypothetical protein